MLAAADKDFWVYPAAVTISFRLGTALYFVSSLIPVSYTHLGYECDYEMKLFYKLYFDMNEDIYVYSNFEYKDKVINVYTEIIYNGDTYFDDFYYDFDTENQKRCV